MQKRWLIFSTILLLFLPSILAYSPVTETLSNVFDRILGIGNLSFLGLSDGSLVVGLTRILIGIFVFTVIFALISSLGGKEGKSLGFLKKNHAIVIAAVLAIMTAIFMPGEVLLATGTGWATAVAFILIGGPVLGIGYILWNLSDWMGNKGDTKGTVIMKLILCVLLFWILNAMKYHVGRMI